jgi:isopentenyl diphosphate isomerase/L-lactate dehydrogenase-like FMN-dependent dehydrogenase
MPDSIDSRFQNLHEFVKAARTNLNRNVWDYLIGGSETETTVARNRLALDSLGFRPRVLCDVSEVDCSAELFGRKLRIPVLLAPVGSLESFEPGGGATVARAATEFGNGMILSSVSHPGLEATAEASGGGFKIFQLYVRGDAAWVEDHFRRAIDAGYDAFCLTVDTDHYSRRERDIAKRHQRQRVRVDDARIFQARQNWRDVERYKTKFDIPLILKGIATIEDARRAVELGVDCVYVSNHGGRQLDHGLGTIDVLPEIVAAVDGRARIILDGGISRGTDVVKAMILGADAVACGRLYVYGLAAGGGPGIVRLLEILEDEITICLALLGVASFAGLDKSYLCPARPVTTPHVHSAFPLLDLPRETY